jgi:alanine-alpha-ketoisovalerate/valine-pyruvate aminotransferase
MSTSETCHDVTQYSSWSSLDPTRYGNAIFAAVILSCNVNKIKKKDIRRVEQRT